MQRLSLLAIFFCLLHLDAAELRLEIEERIKTNRKVGPPSIQENLLVVRFGDEVFYTLRNRHAKFYDVKRDWIIETREGAKLVEYPVLAVLAERVEGLMKSLDTYRMMSRAGVLKQNDRYAMFNLETRYAMQSDIKSSIQPRKDRLERAVAYTVGGDQVASWTDSDYRLNEDETELFRKFLLYEGRIHPEVLKDLVSKRRLPKELRFQYETSLGEREVRWRVIKAGLEPQTAFTEALRTSPSAQADEVDRIIIEELPKLGERALSDNDFEKMFAKSVDLRYYLDAMLVSVEYYLMSGKQTVNAFQTLKPFIELDPQLMAYLNGLDVSTRGAAKASMIALADIDRTNIFRQHILDVALADTMKESLKYNAAEELYVKALQQNPYMTGVWVSLGDLYYRTMRMEKAWKCWNAAFLLQGDHPALDPIKDRNELFSASFPEYF